MTLLSRTSTGPSQRTAIFTGSLNKNQSNRDFPLIVAVWELSAELEFKRVPSMTVPLLRADGTVMASSGGTGVVQLRTGCLSGGPYVLRVGGATSSSFLLTARYWE